MGQDGKRITDPVAGPATRQPRHNGARRAAARHRWIAWLALACCEVAIAADPAGRYAFRSYGADQGLLNQAVTSLAQDGVGFLYAGTEDGLFRYDGDRFLRFGTAAGLPSDGVTLLHATPRGQLWVGTQKGVVPWAASGDRALGAVQLPGKEVLGIASASNGSLLVATSSGFFQSTPSHATFAPIAGVPAKAGAAWLADDGGQALLAVAGVLYLRDGPGPWRSRALPAANASQAVQAIVRDRRGRFWLRGRQLLLRLSSFDGAVEDLSASLPGAAVQRGELYLDHAGRVWAPSNHGLAFFDGDQRSVIDIGRGLPHEWATTAMLDREGSLWVASEGVHRLLGRLAWTAFGRREGLPSDTVWGVFRDRAGTLWAATNSGVAQGTASGWRPLALGKERSFYAFAESPSGELWIGGNTGEAAGNSLLLRAPGATQFRAVPLSSAVGASTVNSLAIGPDARLYVATMAHGLHRIVAQGDGFQAQAVALPGGAGDEQVNQLARANNGWLWAASMRGLAVFDGRQWRRFSNAHGLLEMEVETVTPADAQGGVWVSYWNLKGLTRVRMSDAGALDVSHATGPPALVGDTIYSAGSTTAGELWLGTAMGVKRWRDGRVERFGRGDGLPGDDAAANAFWGDRNGDAWFGMANGLARFDADRDGGRVPVPVTRVISTVDGAGASLPAALPEVAWRDRALTFHFATLSFLDPTRLQRQVRLRGLEEAWRDASVNEARYTGLLPGRYTFQMRARLDDGGFGPVASRTVLIRPPWWLSWWFLLTAAAVALLLLRALLRWQTAQLSRRNAQLEALVDSRTQDLRVANAALEEASMVDPLTGLKNRRYLKAFMPEELAQCLRLQRRVPRDFAAFGLNIDLCLLMVDLDHFKSVNDTYGHAAGDAVLRQVGEVMRAACRASDVVVRWGGEEFLILARNANREQARVLAEQVCQAVRGHEFDLGNGSFLRKTCSLGFTAYPLLPGTPEQFTWEQSVELADQCLYAAKHNGRDGWVGCMLLDPALAPASAAMPGYCELPGFGPALLLTSLTDVQALCWGS